MTVIIPQCTHCKHHIPRTNLLKPERCKAFPKRIPEDVFLGKIKHKGHLTGQVGKYRFVENNA